MLITDAFPDDLAPILALQRLAFQSEAELLGDYSIPPLRETFDDLIAQYSSGVHFLKAEDADGTIVGSVRATPDGDTLHIGKLMTHPDHRRKGLGTLLLRAMELRLPRRRYELFTSSKSAANLALYERLGYNRFAEREVAPGLVMVYLEKWVTATPWSAAAGDPPPGAVS